MRSMLKRPWWYRSLVEYLWDSRQREDGAEGDLNRIQVSAQYLF